MNMSDSSPILLGVNIDHVATLRQARYRECPGSPLAEPSPVEAALLAEKAGADGITAHLRQDRRHILDADIFDLKARITTKLNLEMGNTPEILEIALKVSPEDVCLVPESRQEVTTEGGLDCAGQFESLRPTIARLRDRGIHVSLFIDPEESQVEAAAKLEADFIELHTGAYANAAGHAAVVELEKLTRAARLAGEAGLRVNAGHGLNYQNVKPITQLPGLVELNIGHSIVSRAVFEGMGVAVRQMKDLLLR